MAEDIATEDQLDETEELGSPIIVALDYHHAYDAFAFVDQLKPDFCRLKVGKEMYTRHGPEFVRILVRRGFDVFLDLKFHDIPNTVAKAVAAAADLDVWMVNVHASGGSKMMQAAAKELELMEARTLLTGVTVLTSMEQGDLKELGIQRSAQDQVLHLARLAKEAGLHGVVSSSHETRAIKSLLGDDFLSVTPGIRPPSSSQDDQKRVVTHTEAQANGSDYLVIGRPITQAEDPIETLERLNAELGWLYPEPEEQQT